LHFIVLFILLIDIFIDDYFFSTNNLIKNKELKKRICPRGDPFYKAFITVVAENKEPSHTNLM